MLLIFLNLAGRQSSCGAVWCSDYDPPRHSGKVWRALHNNPKSHCGGSVHGDVRYDHGSRDIKLAVRGLELFEKSLHSWFLVGIRYGASLLVD